MAAKKKQAVKKQKKGLMGRLGLSRQEAGEATGTDGQWEKAARNVEAQMQADEKARRAEEEKAERERLRQESDASRQALQEAEAARKSREQVLSRDLHRREPEVSTEARTLLQRIREGIAKTRERFSEGLARILYGKKEIDQELLDDLEELLMMADVGPVTAQRLLDAVTERVRRNELSDPARLQSVLREAVLEVMDRSYTPGNLEGKKPAVILFVGVNGTGKTTTIGKLAAHYKAEGKKVLMAAGDTFRAAATEQLQGWGQRVGCEVFTKPPGADPSGLIYQAVEKAMQEDYDVVLCDTAGRLHTKSNLMEELKKVKRVLKKLIPDAPHETYLVLDGNTGQNAIYQTREFNSAMEVSGLVITKLDGTARGGVVVGIVNEFEIPVRYIGIGEKAEDLRPFDPRLYAESLFG